MDNSRDGLVVWKRAVVVTRTNVRPAVRGDPEVFFNGVVTAIATRFKSKLRIREVEIGRIETGLDAAEKLVGAAGRINANLRALKANRFPATSIGILLK